MQFTKMGLHSGEENQRNALEAIIHCSNPGFSAVSLFFAETRVFPFKFPEPGPTWNTNVQVGGP